jgi:curved DNA-binding protein CbpA
VNDDPFALLGLPTRADLSDDDVRAAWRRIAAATHPDRDDGGDPARFGAAAAAYATLRTGFGRGEAIADLAADGGGLTRRSGRRSRPRRQPGGRHFRNAGRVFAGRVFAWRAFAGRARTHGRHGGAEQQGGAAYRATVHHATVRQHGTVRQAGALAARAAVAAAVAGLAFAVAGWAPSSIGVLAGVLTWLLVATWSSLTWF